MGRARLRPVLHLETVGALNSQEREKELVRLAANGDTAAFEQLVDQYQSFVFSVVAKYVPQNDVPDVANETFIAFFRSIDSYRGEGSLKGWLATIATRRAYDYWRIVWRHREKPVSSLSEDSVAAIERLASSGAENKYREDEEQRVARQAVGELLNDLSPEDRLVVSLVHLEELSIEEAAKRLGWTKTRVKVRAFRARQKMKELLEGGMK